MKKIAVISLFLILFSTQITFAATKTTQQPGCIGSNLYSATTGQRCSEGMVLGAIADAGCTATSAYSVLSGQKCIAPGMILGTSIESKISIPTETKETVLFLGGEKGAGYLQNQVRFNDVYASSNMTNWSLISPQTTANQTTKWSPRRNLETVYFNNKYWVIGGAINNAYNDLNDIWASSDGITWIKTGDAPFDSLPNGPRYYPDTAALVLGKKMYLIDGGNGNTIPAQVWSSSDGITWTLINSNAPFHQRTGYMTFTLNGKMYLAGGNAFTGAGYVNYSDVWASTDGIGWKMVANNLPWGPLMQSKAVVLNKKVYLLGGVKGAAGANAVTQDIWSSTDAINWINVSHNLPISYVGASFYSDAVVANNKIWFGDGQYMSGAMNHLWSSVDGVTWVNANVSLPWSPRMDYRFISNMTAQ